MRRLMLLIAAGSLWLFLAAVPALADGGPHVAAINSGASSLTADGCAGCHRAHTAQGAFLLKVDEEDLCLSCHGAAGTGATTSVMTGVQYALGTDGLRDSGVTLGALRGGGFDQARIGDPFRYTVGTTRRGKVQVASAGADVTSAHLPMTENGLTEPGIAWGNGANGSGIGPAVEISCGSCHNPHGNGQYRILNVLPEDTGGLINDAWVKDLVDVNGTTNVYRTSESHGLLVGDTVTVAGSSEASANVANATIATLVGTNGFTLTGVDPAADGTGGTVTRVGGVGVNDAAPPAAGDERNYTVIQTSAAAGYTLYASQLAAFSPTDGDYLHRYVPWNGSITGNPTNADAPNGQPATFNDQISAWCASCHSRYLANQNPTTDPPNGTVDNSWRTPREGDAVYTYQHRVRNDRACTTCHVSHGSNAIMSGAFSSTFTYPDGTASDSSRLLKVGNRGTCQMCHDPTGTSADGDQYPPAPYPVPGVP